MFNLGLGMGVCVLSVPGKRGGLGWAKGCNLGLGGLLVTWAK